MSVYSKLQTARLRLQSTRLAKTGKNDYAGYQYFELGDFLPSIQTIFADLGLCGTVSFTSEQASLTIVDLDDISGERIVFTSPFGSAALKGCHEVQNIGAVETYQRRYLWVTAMEIVEHDVLDQSAGPVDDDDAELFADMSRCHTLKELQEVYKAGMKGAVEPRRTKIVKHYEKLKLDMP